ncbi:MAG: FtsX-like permease family protein, partial [Gemmatimonadaceae bacterium]
KFFGRENPIWKHFGPGPGNNAETYEIVGVASNVRYFAWSHGPMYFVPEAQSTNFSDADLQGREVWSHYFYSMVIWAPGNPASLESSVRAALAAADPGLVTYGVRSYDEVIRTEFSQENMVASLAWLFGAIALVLAGVGLYGVTAYGVEQRTREIGVRVALGANARSVVAMVLREAGWQVGAGVLIGMPAAIVAGRLIAAWLFGVKPWDALLLLAAASMLALAALVAAMVPARRAACVSPMEALRVE